MDPLPSTTADFGFSRLDKRACPPVCLTSKCVDDNCVVHFRPIIRSYKVHTALDGRVLQHIQFHQPAVIRDMCASAVESPSGEELLEKGVELSASLALSIAFPLCPTTTADQLAARIKEFIEKLLVLRRRAFV